MHTDFIYSKSYSGRLKYNYGLNYHNVCIKIYIRSLDIRADMDIKLVYIVTNILMIIIPSNGTPDDSALRFEKQADDSQSKGDGFNSLGADQIGQEWIRNGKLSKAPSHARNIENRIMNQTMNSNKHSMDVKHTVDPGTMQPKRNRHSNHKYGRDFKSHKNPKQVFNFDEALRSAESPDTLLSNRASENSESSDKFLASSRNSNIINEKMSSAQISHLRSSSEQDPKACTKELFGGDDVAYQACRIQDALQNNWFPSPVAGLYYR